MKKQQTTHGALRDRTRATMLVRNLVCALVMSLLGMTPVQAIDYVLTQDVTGNGVNHMTTPTLTVVETIERKPSMDYGSAYCWKVILSDGNAIGSSSWKRALFIIYSPSATEIPTGMGAIYNRPYKVTDTKEPYSILISQGMKSGLTASTATFDTDDIDGSYIMAGGTSSASVYFIRNSQNYGGWYDGIVGVYPIACKVNQNKFYIPLENGSSRYFYNSTDKVVQFSEQGEKPYGYSLTPAVYPSQAASDGCTAAHGGGTYTFEDKASLTATPAAGWVFVQWKELTNGLNNPQSVSVISDTTVTAFFVPSSTPQHTIYLAVNNDTYGRLSGVGSGNELQAQVNGANQTTFYEGTTIFNQSARKRNSGVFVKWSDGSHEQNRFFTVGTSDATYTAYFVAPGSTERTITINTSGSGTATGDGDYYDDCPAFLTAVPDDGATFDHWENGSGENVSTDNPYQFTVSGNATYTAVFSGGAPATPTYTVSATVSPAGAGTVTGTGTFDEGDDVTLTATPANRRYVFSHWTDEDSSAGTDGVATYSINSIAADHNNVVAVFTEVPVTLADNEETAYYTATASTFTGSMDFQMMRTFYAGMWNTVCFPFDLTADQITASDMSTATFYTLSSVTGDPAEGLDFNVNKVTSLSARTPYLVQVSGANIVNPVFEGVTLAASAFTNNTSGTNVGETHFFGTVHPTDLEIGENSGFLFLGQNNALYWPNVANKIRAFRAYFYNGSSVVQSVHPRVRLVVRPETPTDVIEGYNADTWSAVGLPVPTRKVLDNGNLIIERDGIRYNAVGQIIR